MAASKITRILPFRDAGLHPLIEHARPSYRTDSTRSSQYPEARQQVFHMSIEAADRNLLVAYLTKRSGDAALAEDIAHDAIVKLVVFKEKETVRHPRTLLFKIADNLLINAMKAGSRRLSNELDDEMIDDRPSAEKMLLDKERLARIQRVIDKMPRKRREVFIRRRLHNQSREEIAAAMKLSVTSVEKHIARALTTLRQELDELRQEEVGL